jgi:hypothetical protein
LPCPGHSSFTSRIWETRSARSHISPQGDIIFICLPMSRTLSTISTRTLLTLQTSGRTSRSMKQTCPPIPFQIRDNPSE